MRWHTYKHMLRGGESGNGESTVERVATATDTGMVAAVDSLFHVSILTHTHTALNFLLK